MLEMIDAYWFPVLLALLAYNGLVYRWALADQKLFNLVQTLGHDPAISSKDYDKAVWAHQVSLNCCWPLKLIAAAFFLSGKNGKKRYSGPFIERYERDFIRAFVIRIAKRSPISFVLLVLTVMLLGVLKFLALVIVATLSFNLPAHATEVPKNTAHQAKSAIFQMIGRSQKAH